MWSLNRTSHVAFAISTIFQLGCLHLLLGDTEDSWARFRGPSGAGVSDGQGIPVEVTSENLKWRVELPGTGHSSPVVIGRRVFLTAYLENSAEREVLCLDSTDGSILWKRAYSLTPYRLHRFNSFVSSTPCADRNAVYLAWVDEGYLHALALDHEGGELWQRKLGENRAKHGYGASPVVVGDILVVSNVHKGESFYVGLNASTGKTVWKLDRLSGNASYATPTQHKGKNGLPELLLSSTANGLTSINPLNGTVNWQLNGLFEKRCVASPVVMGDLIFCNSGQGGSGKEGYAVRPGGADAKPEIVYELRKGLPYVPTPVIHKQWMFLWGDGGIVSCLDIDSGKVLWKKRVGGEFYSSPLCIAGKIYALSRAGEMLVIEASDKYKELARSDLGESVQATPAIANGNLFIRTTKHLLCVGS